MPIDPSAVGSHTQPIDVAWGSTDALLYAVAVGAGAGDPTGPELPFTTENSEGVRQQVLPTFPVVLAEGDDLYRSVGTFDPAMLVHGEEAIELHGPLPVEGRARVVSTVTGVYDKGSGALVVHETLATDPGSGRALYTIRSSSFIRGEGGFGGDRGPSGRVEPPEGAP
ncbi:enoyl-CoA hydratase, partial [Acidimicrobiaceae bacterium USS-CC1]|nr:enoyl-CoA hydratase [Acidiferrimicrobium australe]